MHTHLAKSSTFANTALQVDETKATLDKTFFLNFGKKGELKDQIKARPLVQARLAGVPAVGGSLLAVRERACPAVALLTYLLACLLACLLT